MACSMPHYQEAFRQKGVAPISRFEKARRSGLLASFCMLLVVLRTISTVIAPRALCSVSCGLSCSHLWRDEKGNGVVSEDSGNLLYQKYLEMEEIQDWAKSDDGVTTDSDFEFEDWNDEDRQPYNSGSIPKLQPRKAASKAEWIEEIGMAEVVMKKGGMWISTGIIRGGKLYCTIEEIAFFAERGALLLVDGDGTTIPLKDIYAKIANGGYGCCWESFEAYRHLKSLGYVVGRHGSPWTLKGDQSCRNSISPANTSENSDESENGAEENTSIIHQIMDISITAIKPKFSVYLPNSKFRKSSPGDPNFILCLLRENPPSEAELLNIEKDYKGVSLKFCSVESGRVSFFSFDRVDLPVLP